MRESGSDMREDKPAVIFLCCLRHVRSSEASLESA